MDHTAPKAYLLPALLLGLTFAQMLGSAWNDSATTDELAHIPAGYSYVFLRDYRLNPEHPPLIKDLAALPLIFTEVNFPTNVPSWTDDINGQWAQGATFLYEAGNNPDTILRLMRLPMMLLAALFGWLLWLWARRAFDHRVANLTLLFYAFSPTFIAHSRYVTTDLAAAFGFFIGIATFVSFLKTPSWEKVLIAGLAFGIAQLLKFSLILLLPVYGILLVAWTVSQTQFLWRERIGLFFRLLPKVIVIVIVAIILISAIYAYHVWNYPPDRQLRDADFILTSFGFRPAVNFNLWLIKNDVLRPLGQYLLGLLMVIQRSAGGNTQYFLGEVTAAGQKLYFPVLYLLKEPIAFHILSATALAFAAWRVLRSKRKSVTKVLEWIRDHFVEFTALAFIAVYWFFSIRSNLNIGVRHVLPTFPFIYILVAREMVSWLRSWPQGEVAGWREWLKRVYQIYIASIPRYLIVAGLLIWMVASVLLAFPHFLSYYNELAGGTDRGYLIGVDSNYDWGQDLKRLAEFVEANTIQKIAVDYFGGGSPSYYLGEKIEPWWSSRGYPSTELIGSPSTRSGQTPGGVWFAVSATLQMGAYGEPVKGFVRRPEDSYEWLKPFRPVARAGKSIFIYNLPNLISNQPE